MQPVPLNVIFKCNLFSMQSKIKKSAKRSGKIDDVTCHESRGPAI